jgi:hypothetical protein
MSSEDDTTPRLAPEEAPFDIGDRTIFQMRNQRFDVEEYGTIVNVPHRRDPLVASATEIAPEPAAPMERIEQKLDAALRALDALQHRVDSLDALLSRVLHR